MSQIAITYNLESGKIVTVPVGQTISGDWSKFETVAVVPQNKVDFAIGIFLTLYHIRTPLYTIQKIIHKSIEAYDRQVTHLKNTDL